MDTTHEAQEAWLAYAAKHGLAFDDMLRGRDIVGEDADYYSRVGFAGLAESLRIAPVKSDRERYQDEADVNRKRC